MIKFEKVSYEQFKKDSLNIFKDLSEDKIKEAYDNITLPKRGSAGSAGYDFYSPYTGELSLFKDDALLLPTGIKAQMPKDVVLMIYPRSGIGFKTGTQLANTVGVIDSDYYNNANNEGHIMVKLVLGFTDLEVKAGDRIVQGMFINYLTTDDDDTNTVRAGGFGSTGVSKN